MTLRMTTQQFIEQATKKHGDKYDYSKVIYLGSKQYVTIICKTCSKEFQQTAFAHLRGDNCSSCTMRKARTGTTSLFVAKAIKKHGATRYEYSKVDYVGKATPVINSCTNCGEDFYQKPHEHLNGHGCQRCALNKRSESRRMTRETFISKAMSIHKNVDYSLVQYTNYTTMLQLRCTLHNCLYQQTPKKHIQQRGCPMCHTGMFSHYACKWLAFKSAWDNTNIQHALNGGEVFIQGVGKVDGFSAERNKVYEFHGKPGLCLVC